MLLAGRLIGNLPASTAMILVTGSAGKTGRAIIRALTARGETVRALVHSPDQVPTIQSPGVEDVAIGDMREPSVMEHAAKGTRAIYHIAPNVSPDEVSMGRNAIAAAQAAGVEHFVFHSVLHPQVEAMPHHWLKSRVEELLFQSGLLYTILQPAIYMQNILAHWDQILKNGKYPLPYSEETRLSMVDLEDVAKAAATVLTEPGHSAETIELVGTPGMTQVEVAEVLTEQLRRPVSIEVVPIETWKQGARNSGLGDYQILTLTKMFCYYESYGFTGNSNALRALLQRQPASFVDFVKRIINERKDDLRVG